MSSQNNTFDGEYDSQSQSQSDETSSFSFRNHVSTSSATMSQPTQSQPSQSSGKKEYPHDYLSMESALALGQKVTCYFLRPVTGLGFIDPASEMKDISAGTKLELPLWLARVLYARKMISIEVPTQYGERQRDIFEAGATVEAGVDLHKLGPNYYTFGKHLVTVGVKDSDLIAQSMVKVFHDRLHPLLDFAMNPCQDTQKELIDFTTRLDEDEKQLLSEGRKATEEFKKWEMRRSEKLTANPMVTSLNRRKRAMADVQVSGSKNSRTELDGK